MSDAQSLSILYVSQSFYPAIGGVSSLILDLIRALALKGYEIHAAHFAASDIPIAPPGLDFHDHPIGLSQIAPQIYRGYARFKELLYQHLHGLIPFNYSSISDVPGYEEYIACVTAFACCLEEAIQALSLDIIHIHDYQLIPCVERLSSRCIVLSLHAPLLENVHPVVWDWLAKYTHSIKKVLFSTPDYAAVAMDCGLPRDKVAVIPPLCCPTVIPGTGPFFPRPENAIVIGAVQRFDAKAGHAQLIDSYKALQVAHPNLYLLIVGGPSFTDGISAERHRYYAEALALAADAPDPRRIIFLGAVDFFNLPSVYRSLDVFCMLSKMECFGLALTASMFHGVPAIATRVGGLRYQVLDEETGYLVSVGDVNGTIEALRRLITSSALRERLGDRARQRFSQTFSPQKIVKELMETYRSCVVGARL